MTLPEVIFLVAVILVGIPAARFNLTAVGLVASYGISQLYYWATGDGLTIPALLLADYTVIVLITAKPDAVDCPYTGIVAQICALWGERSREDKLILLIFPLVWLLYAIDISAFYQWWALWWLALLQLLIAAHESYSTWQQRNDVTHAGPDISFRLRLAWFGYA